MNDRELLEAAGRAAGQERSVGGDLWSNARGQLWNPLTDDGDALRLAVKLRLSIVHESERVYGEKLPTVEVIGPERRNGSRHCEMHSLDDDPMATVRRCITRAAAALAVSDLAKMEGAK